MDQVTPMFPLQSVLLPGEPLPLRIFEPRYAQLAHDVMDTPDRTFGVVLIARGREVGGGDVRNEVGTAARLLECQPLGLDTYALRCVGTHRIRVRKWLPDDPYPCAEIDDWPDEPDERVLPLTTFVGLQARIENVLRRRATARRIRLPRRWSITDGLPEDPEERLYMLTSRAPIGEADRYDVLAAPTLAARARALNDALDTLDAILEFSESDR